MPNLTPNGALAATGAGNMIGSGIFIRAAQEEAPRAKATGHFRPYSPRPIRALKSKLLSVSLCCGMVGILGCNSTWLDRLAVVNKTTDQKRLSCIALDLDEDSWVRKAAALKLNDQAALELLVTREPSTDIRNAAITRLTDPILLSRIIATPSYGLQAHINAVQQLHDQSALAELALHHTEQDVRMCATRNLETPEVLNRLAVTFGATNRFVCKIATLKVTDREILAGILNRESLDWSHRALADLMLFINDPLVRQITPALRLGQYSVKSGINQAYRPAPIGNGNYRLKENPMGYGEHIAVMLTWKPDAMDKQFYNDREVIWLDNPYRGEYSGNDMKPDAAAMAKTEWYCSGWNSKFLSGWRSQSPSNFFQPAPANMVPLVRTVLDSGLFPEGVLRKLMAESLSPSARVACAMALNDKAELRKMSNEGSSYLNTLIAGNALDQELLADLAARSKEDSAETAVYRISDEPQHSRPKVIVSGLPL